MQKRYRPRPQVNGKDHRELCKQVGLLSIALLDLYVFAF